MYRIELQTDTQRLLTSALELIKISRRILVYFDPDPDGVFSGMFICRLLTILNKTYDTYINPNRMHGYYLPMDVVYDLVITVDFAIPNDTIEKITENSNLINIDHHNLHDNWQPYFTNNDTHLETYCFNSMSEHFDYHFMSAGVFVYHLIEYWLRAIPRETLQPLWDSHEMFGLSGITLLSDLRPIENDLAKDHLITLETLDTDYTNYLLKYTTRQATQYDIGTVVLDRLCVDFSLNPSLNAAFRCGKENLVVDFLLQRIAPRQVEFGLYRDIQKVIVTETLPLNSKQRELKHILVVTVDVTGKANLTSFIGLYANKLLERYSKTVLILAYDNKKFVRGSVRGKYDLAYLDLFKSLGLPAEGHQGAFGLKRSDGMSLKPSHMDTVIGDLESNVDGATNPIEIVPNLCMVWARVQTIAMNNKYVRAKYQTLIKYVGDDIFTHYRSEQFVRYSIDGYSVQGFDPDLKVSDGYLLPMMDKGYLTLTLKAI